MTQLRRALLIASAAFAACTAEPGADLAPAAGIHIDSIGYYQGPKHEVMREGEAVDSDVSIVEARDGILRVFLSTDDDYDGEPVTVRYSLDGVEELVEVDFVDESAREHRLESTVNLDVPGASAWDGVPWSVEVLQGRGEGEEGSARWPTGGTDELAFDGRDNALRVVVAPFSYENDGSGRLPDLSDEAMERLRLRLKSLYPVSDVELTVRDPEPWNGFLGPGGEGWQAIGFRIFQMREEDGATDDVYYYGLFNPTESVQQFCAGGCLLGVTLLNDSPPDTGSVQLRLAIGVGFDEVVDDTTAHELGHAHGRPHAPCGPPGNLPDGIDPEYPHTGAELGTWAWDVVQERLVDPGENTDIMGYCADQFVSDYTWERLYDRTQNVNAGLSIEGDLTWDLFSWDGEQVAWQQTLRSAPMAGRRVEATASRDGQPVPVGARYVGWDHLPGGVLLVPRLGGAPERVAFTLDGEVVVVDVP